MRDQSPPAAVAAAEAGGVLPQGASDISEPRQRSDRFGYGAIAAKTPSRLSIVFYVLAVPATWAVRGRALACYLPLLFALNLLRVVGLLYVLVRFPEHISLAHDQIAQGIMVVAVMLLWLRYLGRTTPAR